MRCATWSNSKAKTIPEKPGDEIAGDHECKPTVRQLVLDLLHSFLALGLLFAGVYFRAIFGD